MPQRFARAFNAVEVIIVQARALPKLQIAAIRVRDDREYTLIATPARKAPCQLHREMRPLLFDDILQRDRDRGLVRFKPIKICAYSLWFRHCSPHHFAPEMIYTPMCAAQTIGKQEYSADRKRANRGSPF